MFNMGDLAAAAKHAERLAQSFTALIEAVARVEAQQSDLRARVDELAALQRRILDRLEGER